MDAWSCMYPQRANLPGAPTDVLEQYQNKATLCSQALVAIITPQWLHVVVLSCPLQCVMMACGESLETWSFSEAEHSKDALCSRKTALTAPRSLITVQNKRNTFEKMPKSPSPGGCRKGVNYTTNKIWNFCTTTTTTTTGTTGTSTERY